jgi:hypothetical protein
MAFIQKDQRSVRLNLCHVEQLSTLTAIRLCRHARTTRAGGNQDQGVFTDASPITADVLEMLGLDEYLQTTPDETFFVPNSRINCVGSERSPVSADRCLENSEADGLVLAY